jgi:hypothetical protein
MLRWALTEAIQRTPAGNPIRQRTAATFVCQHAAKADDGHGIRQGARHSTRTRPAVKLPA